MPFGAGLKVASSEPLLFRRARLLTAAPSTLVNEPAMTIWPFGWTAIASTIPLTAGANEPSGEPVGPSRAK